MWKKIRDLIFVFLIVLILPEIGSWAANSLSPMFSRIDRDGVYVWVTIHHLVQLLAALMLMMILKPRLGYWGFNLENWKETWGYLKSFFVYLFIFVTAGHVLLYFFSPPPQFPYPLTTENVAGNLLFKLLLSGTSEEPLFRGLVMTILLGSWSEQTKLLGIKISWAGIWATVFFILAHVGIQFFPFSITYIDPLQLVQAAVLGVFYAVVFERTRSLAGSIIAHNTSNVVFTSAGLIWVWLAG